MIRTTPRRRIDGLTLEDYTPTTGQFIGAVAADTFAFNPLPADIRAGELNDALANRDQTPEETERRTRLFPTRPFGDDAAPVDPDALNEEYGHLGLTFNRPIPRRAAEIMAERKREEIVRQHIIQTGATSGGRVAGSLAVGLLVSLADPINVGSAFIPVVGEARFAALTARLGKNAARVVRGSVEGAFGAALVEPIVLSAAAQEQADYTSYDSIMNIAVGTVLGGGLHSVGGAIVDRISARRQTVPGVAERVEAASPQTREGALNTAVSQAVQGKDVDVEPVLSIDPGYRSPRASTVVPDDFREIFSEIREPGRGTREPEGVLTYIQRTGGIRLDDTTRTELQTIGVDARTRPGLVSKDGATFEQLAERLVDEGFLEPREDFGRADIQDVIDAIDTEIRGTRVNRRADTETAERVRLLRDVEEELDRQGLDPNRVDDEELYRALLGDQADDLAAELDAPRSEADLAAEESEMLRAAASRLAAREEGEAFDESVSDAAANLLAEERLEHLGRSFDTVEEAQAALDDVLSQVEELNVLLGNEPLSLDEFDAAIADADALGRGHLAAASCMARRA